jgi:hypothetical protein
MSQVVALQQAPERRRRLLRGEASQHIAGGGEADAVPADDGLVSRILDDHRLADAVGTDKHRVVPALDEAKLEEFLDGPRARACEASPNRSAAPGLSRRWDVVAFGCRGAAGITCRIPPGGRISRNVLPESSRCNGLGALSHGLDRCFALGVPSARDLPAACASTRGGAPRLPTKLRARCWTRRWSAPRGSSRCPRRRGSRRTSCCSWNPPPRPGRR